MDWTLTKTEWRILMALEEGRSVEQLAVDLGLHRTFAHKAVKGLVDKGLVAKSAPISYRATVRVRVEPNTSAAQAGTGFSSFTREVTPSC